MFVKFIWITALFAVAAQAFPIIIQQLLGPTSTGSDFEPQILSPEAGTVWTFGQLVNVTWDTSDIPKGEENSTGMLLLGFQANNSENLDISK